MSLSNEACMSADSSIQRAKSAFLSVVRGPYTVASREPLPDNLATRIVHLVRMRPDVEQPREVLSGRGTTSVHDLEPLGRVFLKRYAHGGLLRALTGGQFLAFGQPRSEAEFEMLELVRGLGVNAPKPFVYVTCGSMVYSTWLLMEEIPNTVSLVELSKRDPDAVIDAMKQLASQLMLLVNNSILHVDLHPGNVLVDSAGKVSIVDFDKAYVWRGSSTKLRDLYLRRWRRAVIKHGLSPLLTEIMSLTLRSYDE